MKIQEITYWTQKVLPQVYDDSLSFSELVGKVVDKVNEMTREINEYFKEDIEVHIIQVLNEWYEDGSIARIINEEVFTDINHDIDNLGKNMDILSEDIQSRGINIKYPPVPLVGAKVDGETDDSDAINAIATHLKLNGGGTILLPVGNTFVKKTIVLPNGVNLVGDSLPYSQLVPSSDFMGEYVIQSEDQNAKNKLSHFYIQFFNNKNVGGIWLRRPYDYTSIEYVVGNLCGKTFIKIGDINLEDVSQTVKIDSCLVYGANGRTAPLLVVQKGQENWIVNNKFFGAQGDTLPIAEFTCATNQTIMGNSFVGTTGTALVMTSTLKWYRLGGNHITHNLFENCTGQYSISLVGFAGVESEGDANSIISNRYLNSSRDIYLDNVTGTQVIDYVQHCEFGSGARRNFILTQNHYPTATNTTGNFVGAFDGKDFRAVEGGSFVSKNFVFKIDERSDAFVLYWNANKDSDLGLNLSNASGQIMQVFRPTGHLEFPMPDTGLLLKTPDGTKQYYVTLGNDGTLRTTPK